MPLGHGGELAPVGLLQVEYEHGVFVAVSLRLVLIRVPASEQVDMLPLGNEAVESEPDQQQTLGTCSTRVFGS